MAQRPPSPKHEYAKSRSLFALAGDKLRSPIYRSAWKVHQFYANFLLGRKVFNKSNENISSPSKSTSKKTSSYYAEFLNFRARQSDTNNYKH